MLTTAARAAEWCGGRRRGGDPVLSGVCIDSRRVRRGDLFVALPGARADGHDFISAAAAGGAAAAMVTKPARTVPEIIVGDCEKALGMLASRWRRMLPARVAAVTGSNGKTTVKGMLGAICAASGIESYCGAGNMNNLLGLPLGVLSMRPRHRLAVLEAGMDAPGELKELGGICLPRVAVITNAQRAHLGGFASVAAIARAKGELIETLPADGTAVLNADDKHLPLWKELAGGRRVLTFGGGANADYRGGADKDGVRLPVWGRPLKLRLPGAHNVRNALAAAAAAAALDLPPEAVAAGLESYAGAPGRLQFKRTPEGVLLIDDTYNANPDSLSAALLVLAECEGEKFAVLGDMLALGAASGAEHAAAGRAARAAGARLWATGECMKSADADEYFTDKAELARRLRGRLKKCKTAAVLVKGSRGMRMETVVKMLEEGGGA